jgi:phosphatidylserine synthase
MFLFGRYEYNIIAALLVSFWLILDCVDGNLARCVKAQPFGEFVDAESSYILVGLIGSCMGISAYFTEGCGVFLHNGNAWVIFAGAAASSCDTLVRLIYQKYQNMAAELSAKNIIPPHREKRTENEYSGSLRVKLEQWPGMGGVLPALIFVCSLFNTLDIAIIYMMLYYCSGAIAFISFYTVKAMRFRNLEMKE